LAAPSSQSQSSSSSSSSSQSLSQSLSQSMSSSSSSSSSALSTSALSSAGAGGAAADGGAVAGPETGEPPAAAPEGGDVGSRKCPYCQGVSFDRDTSRGDVICVSCGAVLEMNVIVSEVTFQESSGGTSSVVGQFVPSSGVKSLATAGKSGAYKESREVTILNGKRKINQVAATLKLNQNRMTQAAERLFLLAVERNFIQGRKTEHVVAACLYVVCRREKTPHMLLDFSDVLQTNVYVLGHCFLRFVRLLNINLPLLDPALYIHRFASRLEFGDRTHLVAITALRLVARMRRDWIQDGRRPAGICGACLLMAARLHGFQRTQGETIRVVRTCTVTLRKRMEEFSATPSGSLTIDEFRLGREDDLPIANPPSYTRGLAEAGLTPAEKRAAHHAARRAARKRARQNAKNRAKIKERLRERARAAKAAEAAARRGRAPSSRQAAAAAARRSTRRSRSIYRRVFPGEEDSDSDGAGGRGSRTGRKRKGKGRDDDDGDGDDDKDDDDDDDDDDNDNDNDNDDNDDDDDDDDADHAPGDSDDDDDDDDDSSAGGRNGKKANAGARQRMDDASDTDSVISSASSVSSESSDGNIIEDLRERARTEVLQTTAEATAAAAAAAQRRQEQLAAALDDDVDIEDEASDSGSRNGDDDDDGDGEDGRVGRRRYRVFSGFYFFF
jgi:transcription initiation factor TFIIIB Brf1 subunit/transcription initiation factor TFIIB